MTNEEAINELKYARAMCEFNPSTGEVCFRNEDDRRCAEALDKAIKALEQEPCEIIKEIPKDYKYDTQTKDFLVYRHKYTGHEIHIEKPVPRYRLEQEPILDKIRAEIMSKDGLEEALEIIDKYKAESEDKE